MLRRTLRIALILACTAGPLLASNPSHAQDAAELSQARAKFQQALELKQAGNWPAALRLLREVGQVRMTPQVRYHIATCEEKLGKLVAALGGYELALADADQVHPDFIAEVQASIEDLRGRIPKLLIERGSGGEAAIIELDGVALGSSSIGVDVPVDPGPHTLSARAPGRRPFSETITIAEEETLTVSVSLESLESDAPAPALPADPADPGADGAEPRYGVLPYVLGGVGAAGVIASGVFFVLHKNSVGGLEDRCPNHDCSALPATERERARGDYDTARTQEVVMWTTLGVGAAALGAGVALYLLDRSPTRELVQLPRGLALRPEAPQAQAGLSLVGTF